MLTNKMCPGSHFNIGGNRMVSFGFVTGINTNIKGQHEILLQWFLGLMFFNITDENTKQHVWWNGFYIYSCNSIDS